MSEVVAIATRLVPGHSRGLLPLLPTIKAMAGGGSIKAEGVHFCTDDARRNQLATCTTIRPVRSLTLCTVCCARWRSSLFPDEVLHLGCDETAMTGPCSLDSTFDLERKGKLATAVALEFRNTPEGWEEIFLFFSLKASQTQTEGGGKAATTTRGWEEIRRRSILTWAPPLPTRSSMLGHAIITPSGARGETATNRQAVESHSANLKT